ncbi:MAG: hypothetical protein WDW38_007566 [Sanguina aurantia]
MVKESSAPESDCAVEQEAQSWVQCDKCNTWRRIPRVIAKQLGDEVPWYCEHNPNSAFSSCSIAQELTNEQIDAENNGSDADEDERETSKRKKLPAVWQLLKENTLGHRKRKAQDEDDIMICHCKPTWRGGDGCGPDCLNRVLCIECVPGFCPCEHKCTNQMFTNKQYAGLEVKRAGAKGFGLFATKVITAGQFVIEYIGEVLEEEEYVRRKEFYLEVGQRHYYFMNVGNGEVIDACRKGNISRFINHSCEPNCETQKWLVKGELAIGLFALKDIALGEELTFDYNFERYGDKPMKCFCASRICRKFIGGGGQDGSAQEDAVIEYHDTAMYDIEPLMVVDAELDGTVRTLLDWRVGAHQGLDGALQATVLARLEKLCKSHGNSWTKSEFSTAAASVVHEQQQQHQAAAILQQQQQQQLKDSHGTASTTVVKSESSRAPRNRQANAAAAAASKAALAVKQVPVLEKEREKERGPVQPTLARPASMSEFKGPLKAAFKQSKLPKPGAWAGEAWAGGDLIVPDGESPLPFLWLGDASAGRCTRTNGPERLPPCTAGPVCDMRPRRLVPTQDCAVWRLRWAVCHTASCAATLCLVQTRSPSSSRARPPHTRVPLRPTPRTHPRPQHPQQRRPPPPGSVASTTSTQTPPQPKDPPVIRAHTRDWDSTEAEPGMGGPSPTAASAEVSDGSEVHEVIPMGPVVQQAVSTPTAGPRASSPAQQQQQQQQQEAASNAPRPSQAVTSHNGHLAPPSTPVARKASAAQLQALSTGSKAPAAGVQPTRPAAPSAAAAFKKRSEIDRRLDGLVAASGRLKDSSKQNIIKVLRMFNLCDIGPPRVSVRQPADRLVAGSQMRSLQSAPQQQQQQQQDSPRRKLQPTPSSARTSPAHPEQRPPQLQRSHPPRTLPTRRSPPHTTTTTAAATPPTPSSAQHQHAHESSNGTDHPTTGPHDAARSAPEQAQHAADSVACADGGSAHAAAASLPPSTAVTARTKARLADLSLLLDVLLKCSSTVVKRDFVACGLLSQVQQVVGRNFGREYAVILRKVCRVMEALPLTADDLHATRSAHGSFADVLRSLSTNADFDVRTKAVGLLRKYPTSAVADPSLIRPAASSRRSNGSGNPHPHPSQNTQQQPGTPPVAAGASTPAAHSQQPPARGGSHTGPPPLPSAHTHGYGPPRSLRPVRPHTPSPAAGLDTPSRASPRAACQLWSNHADLDQNWADAAADHHHNTTSHGAPPAAATPTGSHLPPGLPRSRIGRPLRAHSLREEQRTPGKPPARPDSPARYDAPPTPAGAGGDSPSVARAAAPAPATTADGSVPAPKRRRRSFTDGPEAGSSPSLAVHPPPQPSSAATPPSLPPPPALHHSIPYPPAPSPHYPGAHADVYAQGHHQHHHHHHSHNNGYLPAQYMSQQYAHAYSHQQQHYGHASYHPSWDNMHYYQEELFMLKVHTPAFGSSSSSSGSRPRVPLQPVPSNRSGSDTGSADSSTSFYGQPTSITDLFALGACGGRCVARSAPHAGTTDDTAMELDECDGAGALARNSSSRQQRVQPGPGMSPIMGAEEFSPVHQPAGPASWPDMDDIEQQAGGVPEPLAASGLLVVDLRSMAVAHPEPPTQGPFSGNGGGDQLQHCSPSDATALLQVMAHHPADGLDSDAWPKGSLEEPATAGQAQISHSLDWNRPINPQHHPESWEEPDSSFEAYVGDAVRHRLGKYVLPDHPNRISSAIAHSLHRKVQREVVEKERRAFETRQQQSQNRPIERKKLEANLKEFVRQSIRKLHTQAH